MFVAAYHQNDRDNMFHLARKIKIKIAKCRELKKKTFILATLSILYSTIFFFFFLNVTYFLHLDLFRTHYLFIFFY